MYIYYNLDNHLDNYFLTILSEAFIKIDLTTLTDLYINNNDIGNEGFNALCHTIMKDKVPNLRTLDFSSIII